MKQKPSPTTFKCPACKTAMQWDSNNPNRPFCSERCKNSDFIAWANQENLMPGRPEYEDIYSNDLSNGDY